MLITTTDGIDGSPIEKYLGIVTGEAVFSIKLLGTLAKGIKDMMGGPTQSYVKELEAAKNQAMVEMVKEAEILGAHAIVGVDIDYLEFRQAYFMVVMSGTAVQVRGFKSPAGNRDFMMPTEG